jgi:hypothetical protein
MNHDEITETLRDCDAHASFSTAREAADRLDRYRDALLFAKSQMDMMANVLWAEPDHPDGRLGTKFIDDVLK